MLPTVLVPCASPPIESVETRTVVPACRSRTKMSEAALVSPVTRLVAALSNTTKRPSSEMRAFELAASASTSFESTEMRSVVRPLMSRTNRSAKPLVSPVTKLVAALEKATKLPLAEMATPLPALPLACDSSSASETRTRVFARRSARKMSVKLLLSSATRFSAPLLMATKRPSEEMSDMMLLPAALPLVPTDRSLVLAVTPVGGFQSRM